MCQTEKEIGAAGASKSPSLLTGCYGLIQNNPMVHVHGSLSCPQGDKSDAPNEQMGSDESRGFKDLRENHMQGLVPEDG